jgi:16S rRNA (guanine527-N7)-methyltransferase
MQTAEASWLRDTVCAPLGLELHEDQVRRLLGYVDLLQRWNGTYNLTAVRDRRDMLTLHVADCLAVVPALGRHLRSRHFRGQAEGPAARLLDVGSGGGLPGALWAIVWPQVQVTCVDAVGKKAAFIQQAAGALAVPNLLSVHSRVEQLQAQPFDVVTSRAFASLSDFTHLTARHLAPGGIWLALKGKVPDNELDAVGAAVDVFHVEPLHVPGLGAERCLVWMQPRAPLSAATTPGASAQVLPSPH